MEWLWGQLSYVLALFVATGLVAFHMPKRGKWVLRAVLSCAVILAFKLGADLLFIRNKSFTDTVPINTTISFILYMLTCLGVFLTFDCNFWAAIFCGTVGYCMQHMSQRTYLIFTMYVPIGNKVLAGLVLTLFTAIFYLGVYFLLIRRIRHRNIIVDNKQQFIIATVVVMVTIFFHTFAMMQAKDKLIRTYVILFSILISVIGMLFEFSMVESKNAELEKDAIAKMMNDEREQYQFEKAMIDLVNIKCHDLKHQIMALETGAPQEAVKEAKEAVEAYESVFKTGNAALDTVLARKSHTCLEKNVKITCLADGSKLSFIEDVDIYSLFGNILDNAIEAVERIDDADKRVIALTVSAKDCFTAIHVTNYYAGKLEMTKEGLPSSTKSDRAYHGFGMRSIKMIVEKYGGDLKISTVEDRFLLDILFQAK